MFDDVGGQVERAMMAHPSIRRVTLWGSRARGDATPLSDWDFRVETVDFERVAADLTRIVEPLRPLAQLWEPLGHEVTYMVIADGPVKIDLFFGLPVERTPASPTASVDAHFWDWTLWLGGKHLRGDHALVHSELVKMHDHLLVTLGVTIVPMTIGEAIHLYITTTAMAPTRLAGQVAEALKAHGVVS